MGQAQIKSHLGGGLYSVAYKFDTQRRDALIAQLDRAIATLDARKAVVGEDLIKVDAEYNALAKANPLPSWDVLYAKRQERNGVIREYRTLDAQLVSLRIKRMYARISPEDETLQAWCADLTENLSGNVGTIEVNGLPGYDGVVKLRPGHGGTAAYDYTRDGIVQKTETADSAAAYWNLAMAPGWQRWRPTFRIAAISNIDTATDTCTVTLEPAISQIRPRREDLDINALSVIHGVPVQYMTCNARAFDPGDRVIVEFQDQDLSRPRVIGFADHPKGCGGFRFRLTRGDGLVTSPQNADGFYLFIQPSDLAWWGQISVSGGKCYDTDGNEVPADAVYDSETQEWIFTVPPEHPSDPAGYFATYYCPRGLSTQYPYRYRGADQGKVEDLIQPGKSTDTIPYWYTHPAAWSPEPALVPAVDWSTGAFEIAGWDIKFAGSISRTVQHDTTVPCMVNYSVPRHAVTSAYMMTYPKCSDPPVPGIFNGLEMDIASGDGALSYQRSDIGEVPELSASAEGGLGGTFSIDVSESCDRMFPFLCENAEGVWVPYDMPFASFGMYGISGSSPPTPIISFAVK